MGWLARTQTAKSGDEKTNLDTTMSSPHVYQTFTTHITQQNMNEWTKGMNIDHPLLRFLEAKAE